MKIGDMVTVAPKTFDPDWFLSQRERWRREREGDYRHFLATGKVIYIHPTGRYYTVEFEGRTGKIRESFMPDDTAEAFTAWKEANRQERIKAGRYE